jgi:hypothetical protein
VDWMERSDMVRRAYADYLHEIAGIPQADLIPHCDDLVLHAHGECQYCDKHPRWQAARVRHHIAFTGQQPKPGQRACPAEVLRPAEKINRWYGNVAQPAEGFTGIICDRCGDLIDGFRGEHATAGFYDTTGDSWWSKFSNPGEQNVCDACMWADPRYIAEYGPR